MKDTTQPTAEQHARYSAFHDEFMDKVKADARDLMQENRDLSAEGALVHALALHTTTTLFLLIERTDSNPNSKPKQKGKTLQYKCTHDECGHEFSHVTTYTHGYPDGVSCPLSECGCSAIPLSAWTKGVRDWERHQKRGEDKCD